MSSFRHWLFFVTFKGFKTMCENYSRSVAFVMIANLE